MSFRFLFENNLGVIERATARVCREARLEGADAEDFASSARLALLADDCAILRRFEQRSSLATYLTIVVRRLLVDGRRAEGRWYPSAEARRRGGAAVDLEQLLVRDRRSLHEAVAIVMSSHPEITARDLDEIAAALPERAFRPVFVRVADGDEERVAGGPAADDRVDAFDLARRSRQTSDVVRSVLATMTVQDRVILRLRFSGNAPISSIARALSPQQRPLYRRIEALLGVLRRSLQEAGIDAASVADLIGMADESLDFGLDGKNGDNHRSMTREDS